MGLKYHLKWARNEEQETIHTIDQVLAQSNLAIRNSLIRNKLVLRNHFLWSICHLLQKNKELLALRNQRATKNFLIAKFDSFISRGPRLDWPIPTPPVSCLNECLCIACWAACSQDIMLRVLFSQQISPSIQYNLNYIPLFHYSVLYPLLCWAFSPYYTLQVHIFCILHTLFYTP